MTLTTNKTDEYIFKALMLGLQTESTGDFSTADRQAIQDSIKYLYALSNFGVPEIYYTRSPKEGMILYAYMENVSIAQATDEAVYGNQELYWLSYHKYKADHFPTKSSAIVSHLWNLCSRVGWCWFTPRYAIISALPVEVHTIGDSIIHNPNGPAVRYADGFEVYVLNNVRIPSRYAHLIIGNDNIDRRLLEAGAIEDEQVREEILKVITKKGGLV